MMTDLMVIDTENREVLVQAFTEDRLADMIQKVRDEVGKLEPDLSTTKSRGEIASTAHRVSKFKVKLDGLGKELVAEEKAKIAKIDAARKFARDQLDALRDEVRAPLTQWEKEEEERLRIEAEQIALNKAHEEALAEDAIWEREQALARLEAALEAERQRLAAEAEERERAAREAQEAREREHREREERERREAERKAREAREAQEAKERAAREEQARKEREERIRRETEERTRQQMIREEAERKRLAAEEQARLEKKAAAKRHQDKIRREAAAAIAGCLGDVEEGLPLSQIAAYIIQQIDAGFVDHVHIAYL